MRVVSTVVLSFASASLMLATAVGAGSGNAGLPGTLPSDASLDAAFLGEASLSDRVVPAIARTAPDPAPLSAKRQWIFDLRYDAGDIFLLGMHRVELTAAQSTPRAMGRFALELFEGPTVVERVRFDFPMLISAGIDAGAAKRDRNKVDFEKKLVSRIGVMFPDTSRGNRLELWDRGTDQRWSLPWPPTDTRNEPAAPKDRDGGGK